MKKFLLVFALAFVVAGVSAAPASAAYPTKPVEMTITFKPGGAADISGRTVAKAAEKVFGQPIVAVNRPGAGGTIGFAYVKTAPNDGYKIGWLSASILTGTTMGKLPYDYRAWDYVSRLVFEGTAIVVRADSPYKSLPELVKAAKSKKLKIGSAGSGSFTRLTASALSQKAGFKFRHVPLGKRRVPSLLGGEVDAISSIRPRSWPSTRRARCACWPFPSRSATRPTPRFPCSASTGGTSAFTSSGDCTFPRERPKRRFKRSTRPSRRLRRIRKSWPPPRRGVSWSPTWARTSSRPSWPSRTPDQGGRRFAGPGQKEKEEIDICIAPKTRSHKGSGVHDGESKKIRPRAGRLAVPILLVVFYVWYGSIILELPQGPGEEGPLGPSFIPWLWASLLIVLTLVDIGTACLGKAQEKAHTAIERKGVLDAMILCLLLVGFAVLMQYAGFSAAVVAFLAVSIFWSGIRSWKIIIPYVVIFAFVVNYVFHHVLKVPLPQDWLF